MENYSPYRIPQSVAEALINELVDVQIHLNTVDDKTLVSLDLADLAEEVRHGLKVLSDRHNVY